jgi:hypothetical protein
METQNYKKEHPQEQEKNQKTGKQRKGKYVCIVSG